jgi:ribose transport system permease protein
MSGGTRNSLREPTRDVAPSGATDRQQGNDARRGDGFVADLGSKYALIGILVLLCVVFGVLNSRAFATWSNLQTILAVQATTGLLALAVLTPLVAGHFDLSTGFQFGFAQSLCAVLVLRDQWPPLLAIVAVFGVGAVIGTVNGQLVTRLGLPSFTTTLGTGMLVVGLTQWLTANQVITGTAAPWFFDLGRRGLAGIPLPFVYLAVVAAALFVLLEYTVWGRRAYAIGANPAAAALSGIAADRQVRQTFVVTGLLAALAGCVSTMNLGGSSPSIGLGSLLPAFAAAFLGATCIRPGRYNVAGTVVAVYVIGVGTTGLQQLGAQSYVQDLFNGGALLIALVISTLARRRRGTA